MSMNPKVSPPKKGFSPSSLSSSFKHSMNSWVAASLAFPLFLHILDPLSRICKRNATLDQQTPPPTWGPISGPTTLAALDWAEPLEGIPVWVSRCIWALLLMAHPHLSSFSPCRMASFWSRSDLTEIFFYKKWVG